MKGKPPSNAKCVTDIMYGGNRTCSSERPLIQGAIYAGFLGTIPKLKRLVLCFLSSSTCSSFTSLIDSVLAVALGKHLTHRKTSRRKENRKKEASIPKSELHYLE